jgi:hypothetical protein
MYTAEIDFETEEEHIRLTKGKFATIIDAAAFATDFVRPYEMEYKIACGAWKIYKTDNPEIIVRHSVVESLFSLRAKEAASRL